MSPPDVMLVRIKPTCPRKTHVILGYPIVKERGWHEVPTNVAEAARNEPANDALPDSPLMFDVKSPTEAAVIAETERVRIDPAGTPDQPRKTAPLPPAREDVPAVAAKRRHR